MLRSWHGRTGMNRGPHGGIGRQREPYWRQMAARQAFPPSLARERSGGIQPRGQKFDFDPFPGCAGFR